MAIIGDFAVLPDVSTRPWDRPPLYTSAIGRGRLTAGGELFDEADDHFLFILFDASRQGNRLPIRKVLQTDQQTAVDTVKEFFIQANERVGITRSSEAWAPQEMWSACM